MYQEVATKAKESLHNDWEESEHVREIIEQICSSENSKQILTNGIFTRDFCKPLVMITGYGATDLKSQIMNLNGKKLRSGRFKPSKNEKSIHTLHHESLLESCYEDVMAEITDTGDIAMMNSDDIEFAVRQRFESMCQ